MRANSLTIASGMPDQNLAHGAFFVEQVGLFLVIQFALVNLFSIVFRPIDQRLPTFLLGMSFGSALATLCAALALFFTESNRPRYLRSLGNALAWLTAAISLICLLVSYSSRSSAFRLMLPSHQVAGGQSSEIASAILLLLGIGILLVHSRGSFGAHLADAVASCLGFLLLIIGSEFIFASANVPGASTVGLPSLTFLVCLSLLALVLILRRAEHGIFSVFFGNGIGGRIARILAPIVVLINLGREVGRVQILDADIVPHRYAAAALASIAIIIGFTLLILLCSRINRMQAEIENLTLRDELTGLYSYRGFNLFAEQAFRLERRARQSFGVLFVDMDNLKKINDEVGHHAGSACLVEIAKLMTATFRETDVIGRLGGDEFVVAGQFDAPAISDAMGRLRSKALGSRIPGVRVPLSLSMGCAVSEGLSDETMKSILSRADKAMYKEKRAKKATLSEAPSQSSTVPNSVLVESLACPENDGPRETRVVI